MAYSFTVSSIAVPFVAKFEENLPIIMNTSRQLDGKFKSGTGSTMTVIIPDHPDVTYDLDITPGTGSYASGERQVSLSPAKVYIDADSIVRALDIHSFDEQVATPYGAKLASAIQTRVVNTVKLNADFQYVMTGTDFFSELSTGISYIDSARSMGKQCGALSPILNNKITSSGLKLFNPGEINKGLFRKSAIGEFSGVEFYKSADVKNLVTGTAVFTSATVDGLLAEGDDTVKINAASILNGTTVKAGQGFQIAGVEAVDIYGDSVGASYTFVALEDAVATAGTVTIDVKEITLIKPLANISALPANNAAVVAIQEASSTYACGIVWDDQSLIFANAKMAKISGTDEKTTTSSNLAVSTLRGPDAYRRAEVVRWDTLSGELLARTNWAVVVYLKL
jgi:hypothetical protein